jgi:N6-adenosine-specific RNA methylase IME4
MGQRIKYNTILVNLPWKWEPYSAKGDGRSATRDYPIVTMNQFFIMRNLVLEWAYKDSFLLLWAVASMLPQAMALMKEWGFKFKTIVFIWVKIRVKVFSLVEIIGYFCENIFHFLDLLRIRNF